MFTHGCCSHPQTPLGDPPSSGCASRGVLNNPHQQTQHQRWYTMANPASLAGCRLPLSAAWLCCVGGGGGSTAATVGFNKSIVFGNCLKGLGFISEREERGLLRWDVGAAGFAVTIRPPKDPCLLFDHFSTQCVCVCLCVFACAIFTAGVCAFLCFQAAHKHPAAPPPTSTFQPVQQLCCAFVCLTQERGLDKEASRDVPMTGRAALPLLLLFQAGGVTNSTQRRGVEGTLEIRRPLSTPPPAPAGGRWLLGPTRRRPRPAATSVNASLTPPGGDACVLHGGQPLRLLSGSTLAHAR